MSILKDILSRNQSEPSLKYLALGLDNLIEGLIVKKAAIEVEIENYKLLKRAITQATNIEGKKSEEKE